MKAQATTNIPFWVWTFKYYDIQLKKWGKCNDTALWHLERLRNLMKKQTMKYSHIGEPYQRDISKPFQY